VKLFVEHDKKDRELSEQRSNYEYRSFYQYDPVKHEPVSQSVIILEEHGVTSPKLSKPSVESTAAT
jgi:hypothetical protein